MELYIVRHGQTVWNKKGLLQGSTDICLDEKGIDAAKKMGENMKNLKIDKIYTSPLKRAYDTACFIKGERNIEIIKDERISELCFGDYEGRNMEEMQKDINCGFRYFFTSPEKYIPGEGGETLEELVLRAKNFMQNEIEKKSGENERIVIVAHGAMNKAIMSYIKNNEIKDFWEGGLQKNCDAITVRYDNGKYRVMEG